MVSSNGGALSFVSAPGSPAANRVINEGCVETTIPFSERRRFFNAKVVIIGNRFEEEI